MEKDDKRIRIFNLECSPSYLVNNLSMSRDYLYFIHNSETLPRVLIVNKNLMSINSHHKNKFVTIFNTAETNEMIFVKVIKIKDIEYIAIGLYSGFKLWNTEGSRLLFQISGPNLNQNKIYAFTCCAEFKTEANNDQFSNSADSIIACDNYGQLFFIYGSKSNWKSQKIYSTNNSETITSIGSSLETNHLGVSLDNGDVLILKLQDGICELMKQIQGARGQNISVNNVIFSKDDKSEFFLASGFINGEIKIFSLNDYSLKFIINENLRSVGPMIVRKNNEIITGSDDGQLVIWKYDEVHNKIILKDNLLFEDKMIVGLAYDEGNKLLYVNCFDCPDIMAISEI